MPQARDEAGNIWEIDAQGNPIRLVQPAQQQMPADPGFQFQGQQAAADVRKTETDIVDTQADNRRQDMRVESQNRTDQIQQRTAGLPAGWMWQNGPSGPEAVRIPGYQPPKEDTKAESDKAIAARRILEMLDGERGLTRQYHENFKGGGIGALNEYNPLRADNELFDKTANAMLPFAKKLLRTPGEGAQSDKEAQDYRDQLPRASFRDGTNEQLIADLRSTALSVLENEGVDVSSYDPSQGRFFERDDRAAIAASGATSQSDPIPPEYQKAYSAFVRSGAFTPEQYAAFRAGLDREFLGEQAGDQTETYREEGARILDDIRQGRDLNLTVPGVNSPMSGVDRLRNNIINTPVGAGAANFANMGGFGIPEALSGGAFEALNEQHPTAATIGQIGGAIGGAGMVGRAGGAGLNAITRGATRLNQAVNNTRPVFSNLAADATYSGIYGGITGDNPLASAGQGAVGSLLGQGAGKLGGAALRGVNMSAPVQALRNSGVPLTVGQTLGGFARSLEDKATSIPGVGDMIRNRRIEGMEGFNRAAFKEAGSPLDFTPSNIGKEGVQELYDAASTGYDQATAGVNVPLDAQSLADIALARQAGNRLPPNMQASYNKVLENYVDPLEQTGLLSGNTYQQTARALKAHRAKPPGEGFEQEWKEAIGGNMDALRGTMERGGGADAIEGLRRADGLYRNTKTLEDAINSAAGGSQSGAMFVATPSQLQRAGMKTAKKYGGERPFAGLADAGQEVLPSQVPDSGTAGRIAGMLAVGGGLGGGLGYAGSGGDPSAAIQGALLTGLLAAGGARKAQDLGIASLTKRPDSVRKLGQEIERRRGLFGSGSLPFFIVD